MEKNSTTPLLEFEVTTVRTLLVQYKEKTDSCLSFTGLIIKCVDQALDLTQLCHIFFVYSYIMDIERISTVSIH